MVVSELIRLLHLANQEDKVFVKGEVAEEGVYENLPIHDLSIEQHYNGEGGCNSFVLISVY